ncbi:TPA: hypothetical protein K8M77_000299 [Clostridium perfringens]|nr:hypothetical protein [Clostridium perfringens]
MKKVFAILSVILGIFIVVKTALWFNNVRYEEETVRAVVVNKEYVPSRTYTTCIFTGKTVLPIVNHTSPKYNITVQWGSLTDKIDSKELYNATKVGDSINMKHVKKYTKDTNEFLGDSIKQP